MHSPSGLGGNLILVRLFLQVEQARKSTLSFKSQAEDEPSVGASECEVTDGQNEFNHAAEGHHPR